MCGATRNVGFFMGKTGEKSIKEKEK